MLKPLRYCLRSCRGKFQCFIMWLVRHPSVLPGKHLGFSCGLEVAGLPDWSPEDSCKVRILAPDWESSCFHLAFSWESAAEWWLPGHELWGLFFSAARGKVGFSFHLKSFWVSFFGFIIMLLSLGTPFVHVAYEQGCAKGWNGDILRMWMHLHFWASFKRQR